MQSKERLFYETLKKHIGNEKYAINFSLLSVREKSPGIIECCIPTDFFQPTIEQEKDTILEVASKIWGIVEDIDIVVNPNLKEPNIDTAIADNEETLDKKASAKKNAKQKTKQNPDATKQAPEASSDDFFETANLTFKNFIVGPSNDFAANVAKAIANNPGRTSYNPCLIYGKVGLGKTHLLHAIANEVSQLFPNKLMLYISSENFLNDFVYCSRHNKMGGFRNKYRKLDVLLIDDIQFLSGKEGTQMELFHTFNELNHDNKQMVFSSDRPLVHIKDIEERLISRFQSGINVDLQPPTTETAMGILMNDLEIREAQNLVAFEVIEYISTHMRNNIRGMLGLLNTAVSYSKMTGKTISLEKLKGWVFDRQATKIVKKNVTVKILQAVANYFELGISDLKSGKRNKQISYARRIATYYLREHTNLTYENIADLLNVTHPSSMKAVQVIEEELKLETNELLLGQINVLNKQIFD